MYDLLSRHFEFIHHKIQIIFDMLNSIPKEAPDIHYNHLLLYKGIEWSR